MVLAPTCLGYIEDPETRDNRKKEAADTGIPKKMQSMRQFLSIKFDQLNWRMDDLDKKIETRNKDMKELKQILLGRSLETISRADGIQAANPKYKRSLKDRQRRDADDLHLGNVFVALYEKAQETSADVKTLLGKTEEVLESASECERIPSIIEEIHNSKMNEAVLCEKPKSCLELLMNGHTLSGVYKIYVATLEKDIEVFITFISSWSFIIPR